MNINYRRSKVFKPSDFESSNLRASTLVRTSLAGEGKKPRVSQMGGAPVGIDVPRLRVSDVNVGTR